MKKKPIIVTLNILLKQYLPKNIINKINDYFWVTRVDLLLIHLSNWTPIFLQTEKDILIKQGNISDVNEINSSFYASAEQKQSNIDFYNNGNLLFVIKRRGIIISYSWVKLKEKSMLNYYFKLKQDEYIVVRSYTHEGHRRKGYYKHLLSHITNQMKLKGYSKEWRDIDPSNIPPYENAIKTECEYSETFFYKIHLLKEKMIIPIGKYKHRFKKK